MSCGLTSLYSFWLLYLTEYTHISNVFFKICPFSFLLLSLGVIWHKVYMTPLSKFAYAFFPPFHVPLGGQIIEKGQIYPSSW